MALTSFYYALKYDAKAIDHNGTASNKKHSSVASATERRQNKKHYALASSVSAAQTSTCEVQSYVTAAGAPTGFPVIPALAACSSVCTSPTEKAFPDHGLGYMPPYLQLT